MSKASATDHTPDESRLPKCVTGWKRRGPGDAFYDGSQVLVAVAIVNRHSPDKWYYEFEVVHIRCDEDFFAVEDCNGDPWGWDMDDVDFYVALRK